MTGETKLLLLFDVGGSHISAGVRNASQTAIASTVRVPLPTKETPEAFVETLVDASLKADGNGQTYHGAAISIAGPFDFENGISYMTHKLKYLYEFNLKYAIAAKFGWPQEQVRFLSDADAFLIGEVAAGAAQHALRPVGITLGTGIGSAFAINGRLVNPGSGDPVWRELWDLPYSGATIEDFLSTRAIQRSYERLRGRCLDVLEIAALAASDVAARSVFVDVGVHLGTVIRSIIAPFQPDVVVVGGGIAHSAHLFLPFALPLLTGLAIDLRVSHLLDEAPLVGAGVRCFDLQEA